MLRLFNTLSKRAEIFEPVNPSVVKIFTCGPSVYQRSHIGNFRTFLFEDIVVRYLEYLGYCVNRGMNFTDVEDKALEEAEKSGTTLEDLTQENIRRFMEEMRLLKMKIPEYLPRASENIDAVVEIIEELLALKIAYRYKGNIYFDPLKYPRFGELYGLDMREWPSKKRRFHKDTYPGMRWNLGDFILWHGAKKAGSVYWETRIGRGRPSWNIQDASIMFKYVHETLSIYCGGSDNLYRHHDYTRAILESLRPYPMARFWLHGELLLVNGEKMSKSRGNIIYTDMILNQGYSIEALRFFLIYCPYRKKLNYSNEMMAASAEKLRRFKEMSREIEARGGQANPDEQSAAGVRDLFTERMDDNLNMKDAFDRLYDFFSRVDLSRLEAGVASGYRKALQEIDDVLRVIF